MAVSAAERKAIAENARLPGDPGTLTALIDEQRAKAAAIEVSDADLAAWYGEQLADIEARAARKRAAAERNLTLLDGPHDPRWPMFWKIEAEARYLEDSAVRLTRAGHLLCCPNHGIDGVDLEAPPGFWLALSLRGLLAPGGGSTDWMRYCALCAASGPLVGEVKRLQSAHEAANAPRKGTR